MQNDSDSTAKEKSLRKDGHTLKQPAGLKVLFLAEMWERFGFYTIQTLLVLYLVNTLLLSDHSAYGLFAAFTALTYAAPVLGGFLADRYLGLRPAIRMGILLFIAGYACLFLFKATYLFHFGLSLVILGTGFFKGTVSSLLGELYQAQDIRRNAGFTLFYMGINLGGFAASIICSIVAAKWGFQYAFLLATLGMVLGYVVFLKGQNYLENKGISPQDERSIYAHPLVLLLGSGLTASLLAFALPFSDFISNAILILLGLFVIALIWRSTRLGKEQQRKIIALGLLLLFSSFFWSLYFQSFLSVTLFIDRAVNRHFLGFTLPTAMFQAFNPSYIVLVSPLLAKLWIWLEKNSFNPSGPLKFALGILFMGMGFLVLALAAVLAGPFDQIPAAWLVLSFLLQTVGELLLSPTGLVMVTKLAPRGWMSMLMGLWFLSLAAGNALAGKIANMTALPAHLPDNFAITQFYGYTFNKLGWGSVAIAIILLACTPIFDRLVPNTDELS